MKRDLLIWTILFPPASLGAFCVSDVHLHSVVFSGILYWRNLCDLLTFGRGLRSSRHPEAFHFFARAGGTGKTKEKYQQQMDAMMTTLSSQTLKSYFHLNLEQPPEKKILFVRPLDSSRQIFVRILPSFCHLLNVEMYFRLYIGANVIKPSFNPPSPPGGTRHVCNCVFRKIT